MALTTAQNAAINEKGRTILVSAAAGSGKTFTLTKRIIDKIIGDENGASDISRMLIVTFTRASAQDLREKISKALSKAIAENPTNEHLQKQMLLLGDAKICTIDSFFTDPVKKNFEKLGLPASLRLADDAELDDIRLEIMNGAIEDMYKEYGICSDGALCDMGKRCAFLDLLLALTSTKANADTPNILINIYTKLMSTTLGVELLKKNAERLRNSADCDFFDTDEGKVIQNQAVSICELAAEKFEYCIKKMASDEFVSGKYLASFEGFKTSCLALAQSCRGTYVEAKAAIESFSFGRMPSIATADKTPLSIECANAKNDIGKATTDKKYGLINKYFYLTPDEIKREILTTAEYNEILYKIISSFHAKYSLYKKEKGLCEFADMPLYLIRLLENDKLSVKDEMIKMYDEVYIDEYQDVNEVQDKIFRIIGEDRRFMVGDIKQSIYGFRDAVPELFSSYRSTFPKYDDEAGRGSDGCTIFMSENFRCDSTVIDFTNTVCPYLFRAAGKKLEYTSDDDLKFGKINLPDNYEPPKVQINIVEAIKPSAKDTTNEASDTEDDDDAGTDNIPAEAILCAKEIARLLREETKPNPDDPCGEPLPIEKGDIAILVRANNDGLVVARALKKYGIEYCLSAKSEIFDGEDMKALLDMLRAINNPEDDISLCGFLTSPIYCGEPMFTLAETVSIRRHTKDSKSLMSALVAYGELAGTDPLATLLCRRAKMAVDLISKLRALARKVSADKLLKEIRTYPEFSAICESSAYIFLYDTACNYVKKSWNGLFSFLKYCSKLAKKGSASFLDATPSSAVNIMTIHQSKGLEKNTIFVYNTAKQFSNRDTRLSLNYNGELCCATKLPHELCDSEGRLTVDRYDDSYIRKAVILKNWENNLYEEMRVLYVALTRARERLYVSATIKEDFEKFKNKIAMMGSSIYARLAQKDYISWIVSSILAPDNDVRQMSFDINVFSADDILTSAPETIGDINVNNTNLTQAELSYIETIKRAQNADTHAEKIAIPAKIAASKASPDLLDKILADSADHPLDNDRNSLLMRIELMRSAKHRAQSSGDMPRASATDIGTATHTFLQFCDLALTKNLGVESEIARLVEKRFISKSDAEIINKAQIEKFIESDFFTLLLSCENIRREFRFGLFADAADFAENDTLKSTLSGKRIYVQGSIDILAEGDDGKIYVCDYKTDRIAADESLNAFKARLLLSHKHQLMQYKNAVSTIFGKAPNKIFIYSLPLGEAIELEI